MPMSNDLKQDFISVYVQHEPVLRSYILSLVHNWADADEIIQQVSLTLWQKYEQLDSSDNFIRWACKIARFKVYNFRRKSSRKDISFSDDLVETLAEEMAEETERAALEQKALDKCLKDLDATKTDLLRSYYTGASIKNLALESGRSVESLYKLFQRMRQSLYCCVMARLKQWGDA